MCKRLHWLTFGLFLLICLPASAQLYGIERLFYQDSPEYTDMEELYSSAGIVSPGTAFPISAREMIMMLDRVKPETLDERAAELYKSLRAKLAITQKKQLTLTAGAQISIEGYVQANPQDFGGLAYDGFDAMKTLYPETTVLSEYGHRLTNDENLLYGYKERRPLLNLPVSFSFSPWVSAKVNFRLKNVRSFYAYHYPAVNGIFSGNIITDDDYFDMTFPDEAYISVDGPFFNVLAGRTQSGWGNGKSGNLLLGSHLDYYDNLRVKFFSNYFSYTFQLTAFDAFFAYVPSSIKQGDPIGSGDEDSDYISHWMRYFVSHRFEARLFDRVNVAVSEGVMVRSKTFQFQTLSPIFFMHNSYSYGTNNVSLSIEVDGYIGAGFGAYFQWCSDQMTAPQEIAAMGEKVEPKAFGYLGGFTYDNVFSWGKYSAFLEFVLTDPYMYLEKGQPDQYAYYRAFENGFYYATMDAQKNGKVRKIAKPIGYLYGPDAIVLTFGQSFSFGSFKIKPALTWFIAGENNRALTYETGMAAHKRRTPTGVPEHNLIAQAAVSYKVNRFFEVYGHAGAVYVINHLNKPGNNTADFQLTLGATFTINGTLAFKAPY